MSVPVAKTYRVWIDATPTAPTRDWVEVQLITPPAGEYRSDQIPVLETVFRAVIPTVLRPRIDPHTRTRVRVEASTPSATSLPWCYIEKATPVVEQGDIYELRVVSEDARLHEPGNPTTTVVSWRDHVTLDTLVPAVLAQAGLTLDGVMPVAGVRCDPVYEKRNLLDNPLGWPGVIDPQPGQVQAWPNSARTASPPLPAHIRESGGQLWVATCGYGDSLPRVTPGVRYRYSVKIEIDAGSPLIGRSLRVQCLAYRKVFNGDTTWYIEGGAVDHVLKAGVHVYEVEATAPPQAESFNVHATLNGTAPAGSSFKVHIAGLTEAHQGDPAGEVWHGDDVPTAQYDYGWVDEAHTSNAVRYPKTPRALEVAYQEPGESLWSVVSPHLERMGWRIIPTQGQPGKWSVVATSVQRTPDWLNLLDVWEPHTYLSVDITEDRTDSEWADAVVLHYLWTDGKQGQQEAWDRAGVASPSKVMRVELEQPYPGAGAASRYLAVAQKRGKTLTLVLPLDLYWRPDDTVATYSDAWLIDRIQFDADADTMTITATPI